MKCSRLSRHRTDCNAFAIYVAPMWDMHHGWWGTLWTFVMSFIIFNFYFVLRLRFLVKKNGIFYTVCFLLFPSRTHCICIVTIAFPTTSSYAILTFHHLTNPHVPFRHELLNNPVGETRKHVNMGQMWTPQFLTTIQYVF